MCELYSMIEKRTNLSLDVATIPCRSHLVFGEKRELLFLGNGVGNPGHGQNTGELGADHTFVQLQPLSLSQ